jgi:predicted ATPase
MTNPLKSPEQTFHIHSLNRVAFCGASGTGKTTLAKRLAEHFGVPLSPSMARRAAADMGLASPYEADAQPPSLMNRKRLELQRRITHSRIAWQDENQLGFVSDRTSYDDLAYSLMHGVSGRDYQELADAVILQHNRLRPTYDKIVLCPIASFWRHGGDPARVEDIAYHKQFETLLLELLRAAGLDVDMSLTRVSDRGRGVWLANAFGVGSAAFNWP